jgi:NADH-quinone oxidoreductase subunit H
MIAVSGIAVTLWLGGWMRPFASIHGPSIWLGSFWQGGGAVDFVSSLLPFLSFLFLAAVTLITGLKMPKINALRIQRVGMIVFAGVLGAIALVLLAPPIRDAVQPIFWFMLKVGVFMYLYIWYRATFPRYRFDQLMKVGWKVLLPVSLGVLIVTAVVGVLVK